MFGSEFIAANRRLRIENLIEERGRRRDRKRRKRERMNGAGSMARRWIKKIRWMVFGFLEDSVVKWV